MSNKLDKYNCVPYDDCFPTTRQKIDEVIDMMANGYNNQYIVNYLQNQVGENRQTTYKRIQQAYNRMAELNEKYGENKAEKYLQMLENVLQKCIENGDYQAFNKTLETINKVNPFFKNQEVNLNNQQIQIIFRDGESE